MDIFRRPVSTYIVAGAVLGVLALLLALTKVTGLNVVFDVLIAATTFVAGFAARSRGGRPAWSGGAAGALYGLVSGAKAFGRRTTASQITSALQKAGKSSPVSIGSLVRAANSPGVHLLTLVLTGVVWGAVGLILGAIAGAIAGGREQQRRAV